MLPLLISEQIRQADAYTIANEPITSVDLMERASKAFVGWFINHFPDKKLSISFYCGTGNNGGDGLAIARILNQQQYKKLQVYVVRFSDKTTDDFEVNLTRLKQTSISLTEISKGGRVPDDDSSVIVD